MNRKCYFLKNEARSCIAWIYIHKSVYIHLLYEEKVSNTSESKFVGSVEAFSIKCHISDTSELIGLLSYIFFLQLQHLQNSEFHGFSDSIWIMALLYFFLSYLQICSMSNSALLMYILHNYVIFSVLSALRSLSTWLSRIEVKLGLFFYHEVSNHRPTVAHFLAHFLISSHARMEISFFCLAFHIWCELFWCKM